MSVRLAGKVFSLWPKLLRYVKRQIDAQESYWLPFWALRSSEQRVQNFRRLRSYAHFLRRRRLIDEYGWPALWLKTLFWPIIALVKAYFGSKVDGRFVPIRFWEALSGLLFYNLRVGVYRMLKRDLLRLKPNPNLMLTDLENQEIMHVLNRGRAMRIADKVVFAEFCQANSLPHICTLIYSSGDGPHLIREIPKKNLFFKPTNAHGGKGALSIAFDSEKDSWLSPLGEQLDADSLITWVQLHFGDQPWFGQERLSVDPLFSSWSDGGLPTARVVTVRVEECESPEVISMWVRFPRSGMLVDNLASGGMIANVNLETGKLSKAFGGICIDQIFSVHPDFSSRIEGEILPEWKNLLQCAINAHSLLPELCAAGWDVTLFESVPTLVEANPVFNILETYALGETKWLEAVLNRETELRTTYNSIQQGSRF